MSRRPQFTPRLVAVALVSVVVAGCSPSNEPSDSEDPGSSKPGTSGTTSSDGQEQAISEITALLQRRADAVSEGKRKAFLRTIDLSENGFAAKQRSLFVNLAALPIRSFEYRTPSDEGFEPGPSETRIDAEIVEDVQLQGADQAPVSNSVPMAFVRQNGNWVVTEGRDSPYNGGDVQSRPWSAGPIAVARDGKTVVVVDKGLEGDLPGLVDSVAREIPSIAGTLGLKPRYDLLVDATSSGRRSHLGGKAKDPASAVAFTVYTRDREGQRAVRPAGQRIKLDPKRVEELIGSRVLLRHELSHFLTKGTTDAPQWIEEGLAEYVSYYPTRPSGLVVTGGVLDQVLGRSPALPRSKQSGQDPSADYLIAHAATTYLVDTFGMKKFTRFRLSFSGRYPNPDSQTRKRVRTIFGISQDELLERTWVKIGEFHSG